MPDPRPSPLAGIGPMLRLDLANLASWRRAAPFVLVGMLFMAYTAGVQMAAVMLYVGSYFLAVNTFTMDDRYRLPLLYGGLPVTRRAVLTSHYLVALAAVVAALVLLVPCAYVATFALGTDLTTELGTGLGVMAGVSLVLAAILPLVVRYGVTAMSYAALGIMAALGVVAFVVRATGLAAALPSPEALTAHPVATSLALLAVVTLGWLASYALSLRSYETRDF